MTTVQVYSARTWGAMGNMLAGRRLGALLDRDPGRTVEVQAVEDTVAWMASAGEQIAAVTTRSGGPDAVRAAYGDFARSCARLLPRGFEVERTAPPVGLEVLADRLAATRPDVVIGTKGVVSRMLTWCVRSRGLATRVMNYVTNPGLFEMDMHVTPHADLVSVPFPWDRDRFCARAGVPASRVVVAGPLLAGSGDGAPLAGAGAAGAPGVVLVLNNRGGPVFTDLVAELAAQEPDLHVACVVVDQPDELARTREVCRDRDWEVFDRLPQQRYLELLEQAGRTPGSFLVSKAGPNTVLEAANRLIPLLVVPSGLPMEDWVPTLVVEHGLGTRVDDGAGLAGAGRAWLDPAATTPYRSGAETFRADHLDQQHTAHAVTSAVLSLESSL